MERINFREIGDLGQILQKSAQFIRQNFLSIFKSALLIVIIPFAVGAVVSGASLVRFYSNLGSNMMDPNFINNPFSLLGSLIPGSLLMSIAYMLFYIVTISYLKQYVNGVEEINQSTIWEEVKKHILKVFFGGILVLIITYIGMVFCFIPGIYFSIVFSHIFAIAIVEGKSFGESFSKSFRIIKGQWWNSFLLYLVSTFIISGITFISILPTYIIMFVGVFRNVSSGTPENAFDSMSTAGWLMPIYFLVYLVTLLIMAVIQTTNYYNLVERQEGLGEKSAIEGLGK